MDKMKTDAENLLTSSWFSFWAYSATAGHGHETQRNVNVEPRVAHRGDDMEQSVKDLLADNFWIMPATPEYVDKGVPYITSKNIKNGTIDFSKVNYISQEDYENISKNRPILVGDILISMIGTLGETAEVKESDGLFYGQNMYLVRIDESKVNKRYFLNFFKSNCVKRALEGKQNQSTQKYLKANHIEDLIIQVPDVTKQELIAKQLDKLAYIITLRTNELKQLDNLIKARFVELMDSVELSEETTVEKITEIVKVGFVGTCEKFYTDESGIPMLRTGNITDKGIDLKDLKYVTEEFHEKNKKSQIHEGDLLIARHGSNGQANVYYGAEAQCLNAVVIVPNQSVARSIFLAGLINSPMVKEQIDRTLVGSTQHVVNTKSIASLKVRIPDLTVQKQYEDFVKQVDKSKVVDKIA